MQAPNPFVTPAMCDRPVERHEDGLPATGNAREKKLTARVITDQPSVELRIALLGKKHGDFLLVPDSYNRRHMSPTLRPMVSFVGVAVN